MKNIKILLTIAVASVILSVGGSQALALTGYGSFVPSTEVSQAFNRYQIDSKRNYYICGSKVYPDAIIGIDKGYTLDSNLWQKIDATPKAGVLRLFVVTPEMHRVHHSVVIREHNSNFGFNLPWWDRLFGTYRPQPAAGHEGMTIGLSRFRDSRSLTLTRLLILPFTPKTTP